MRNPPYPDAMNIEIESNTRVTLNFSLSLENGEEVDSNFGADPVSFVMGDGSFSMVLLVIDTSDSLISVLLRLSHYPVS